MHFKFRFQNILDFKIGQEEQAQKELAEWVRRHNKCLEGLNQIEDSRKKIQEEILDGNTGIVISEGLSELSFIATQLVKELESIKIPLSEKRKEYLQAKQEKETFELLKEKEHEKFLYLQKKREQKILDEYGRNMYIIHKEK